MLDDDANAVQDLVLRPLSAPIFPRIPQVWLFPLKIPNLPEPTYSKRPGIALPGMQLLPWRAAHEVIDWSLPCPSIFGRKRPLADKTLLRIEAGLRRFVKPFVMSTCSGGVARSILDPIPTITARGGALLSVPFTVQWDNQSGGGSYCRPIDGPLGTFVTKANQGLAISFLSSYYGNDPGSSIGNPVPTIVTKDRHSLILAEVGLHNDSRFANTDAERKLRDTMRELGVCDIGFRMFQNHELSLAQGFPREYIFCGVKADVTKQIGNSVSPVAAEAITRALVA
jgi:DNA (cytosine-5)-methyltransferase 1